MIREKNFNLVFTIWPITCFAFLATPPRPRFGGAIAVFGGAMAVFLAVKVVGMTKCRYW